jgi:hypothetical protein
MSLGDYVRYLRAVKGGPTPWEIEAASGIPAGIYRQVEQRYRAIGEEELLEKMAAYYGIAPDELRWRQDWPRKGLTSALVNAQESGRPLMLILRSGEVFTGAVMWWDLGAVELQDADGASVVVQRHIVDRWE